MNSSNKGAVKAVSPWLGLQIIPFSMSLFRVGPSEVTFRVALGLGDDPLHGGMGDVGAVVGDRLGDGDVGGDRIGYFR